MKLRLVGCAAACVLASTICASAQDAPETKMKDRGAESASPSEGKGSPEQNGSSEQRSGSRADSSRGDTGKSERANSKDESKKDGSNQNRVEGDNRAGKKDAEKAAEKASDQTKSGAGSANNSDNTDRGDKSADRGGKDEIGRAAESKGAGGKADDTKRDQASDRTDRAGKNVQLSADKRDRVQSSFRSDLKLKRESRADVNISVGSRAPRSWAFAPVPATVVEIVPEYRGYVVAYVEDEYVICDPNTYEVVAVLPASGSDGLATTGRSSGEAGSDGQCSSSLTLTDSERAAILSEIELTNEASVHGVTIGWSVPSDVELKTLPRSVVDRSGKLGGCRYFVVDDQIAIVDPGQDKVVLLIDRK